MKCCPAGSGWGFAVAGRTFLQGLAISASCNEIKLLLLKGLSLLPAGLC